MVLLVKGRKVNIRAINHCVYLLYTSIDQTLLNPLHGLLYCKIGGLDCLVITTEYISFGYYIHRYHILWMYWSM